MTEHYTKRGVCYHPETECEDHYCPFHHPSRHHMRKWPATVRIDKAGLTERHCKHGVGHPDPDSIDWLWERMYDDWLALQVHGCDGCCAAK